MRRWGLTAAALGVAGLALWWGAFRPLNRQRSAQEHFVRSEEYQHLGRSGDAIHEMQLALADDPRYFAARDGLACLYAADDRIPEAVGVYREGIRLSPRDDRLRYKLGDLYYIHRDYAAAAECMRDCLRLAPGDPQYTYLLGMSCERSGRLAEARQVWQDAVRHAPENGIMQRGLARVTRRLRQGRTQGSVLARSAGARAPHSTQRRSGDTRPTNGTP